MCRPPKREQITTPENRERKAESSRDSNDDDQDFAYLPLVDEGEVEPQIEPMARAGISVVSSCEELLYPPLREPRLAKRLDQLCKQHGARVLGTGVNPGFVMDVLPVCLTGVCRTVRAIRIQRVVNAATRRGPLQKKSGSGLPPAEVERRFKQARPATLG